MPAKPRIASVTAAFNPDARGIAAQVEALRGQVDDIIIVDNGSAGPAGDSVRSLEGAGVRVVWLGANLGVGGAFNEGTRLALEAGCDYVLLLDHDSIPAPGMVAKLVQAHRAMAERGPVAAVGPRIRDARDGHEFPFIRLGWTHNPRVRCANDDAVLACDFLISSGSLVSMEAISRVGRFDEELFIDYVDLDWCCRARAQGFGLFGVCGARLQHQLGEEPRRVAGAVRFLVHSPERTYYMTRNRLLLYQRAHVPMKWKLKDVARGLLKLATAVAFVPPRGEQLRMALLAMRDGLRGRGGKLSQARGGAG